MPPELSTPVLLVAALFAPTIAVIVSAFLAGRAAKAAQAATAKAQADAALAQQATLRAQRDAATAQRSAVQAAEKLVITAQHSNDKLTRIEEVTKGTHEIVNSQRTTLLRLIAKLARRIAADNPDDLEAATIADSAESEAQSADAAQSSGIGELPS